MKIFFLAFLIIIFLVLAITSYPISFSRCDQPVRFKIEFVDKRFNLSRDEFLARVQEGADIWNRAFGKTLFTYSPQGPLRISLVFDERQALTNQINQLEGELKSNQNVLQPQVAEYEQKAEKFKKRLAILNETIDTWNRQGGAPPAEYNKLIKEQESLKKEAESLNAMAKLLNLSAVTYNAQVDKLNQTVDTFNQTLEDKPEEGLFDPETKQIKVYFNSNSQELLHTLAHEFGHVLGLQHLSSKSDIMYAFSTKVTQPSENDLLALKNICRPFNVREIIQFNLFNLLTPQYRLY
ncbi:matrixin family metalloprotease [Candidatus Daviesbacteria bacterium]|nr:matrixin family metalloprotease [Candidatus Daviesbacteria bacterium]